MDKNEDQPTGNSDEEIFDRVIEAEHEKDQHTVSPEKPTITEESKIKFTQDSTDSPISKLDVKKYVLYTLVGGLIVSALISVSAVLLGEFNSAMSRTLSTTATMVFHTFVALLLVSVSSKTNDKSGGFIINVMLSITIASFITSVLSIWEILSGRIVADLYLLYVDTFLACLWIQLLRLVGSNLLDKPTRILSQVSIGLTVIFWLLVLPTIFIHYPDRPSEFHYRIMAATVILLSTTSVLVTVFRRIYLSKLPKQMHMPGQPQWDIIIAVIALFIGLPIILAISAMLSSYSSYQNSRYDTSSYDSPRNTSTSTPRSSNTYTYDDATSSNATDTEYNTKPCTKVSQQNISTSDVMLFQSNESTNYDDRLIIVPASYPTASTTSIPYYPQTKFVDKNCVEIGLGFLRKDDSLYFYYSHNPNDFPEYKLSYVQKIN